MDGGKGSTTVFYGNGEDYGYGGDCCGFNGFNGQDGGGGWDFFSLVGDNRRGEERWSACYGCEG